MRFSRLAFAAVVLAGLGGCATSAEVRDIVAQSNLAMLPAPALSPDGNGAEGNWKEAVDRIERFIQEHPEQETTNLVLRVRQGLILAVNLQDSLALQTFKLVEGKRLPAERDRALLAAGPGLAWWYKSSKTKVWDSEIPEAWEAARRFAEAAEPLPAGSDIRVFLISARTLLAAKAANDTSTVNSPLAEEKVVKSLQEAATLMDQALTEADRTWIQANWKTPKFDQSMPLGLLRLRMEACGALHALKKTALEKSLRMTWTPKWVADLDQ